MPVMGASWDVSTVEFRGSMGVQGYSYPNDVAIHEVEQGRCR
jgi:hypothetical protein